MDEDRTTGAARRLKGSIKEAIGKLTGDARTQAEGAAEKVEGTPRDAAAAVDDAVRRGGDK